MLNTYERQLILFYLSNAASRFHHASSEARDLADWVFENHDLLRIVAALTDPASIRTYLEGVGLPAVPPPRAPPQPQFEFAA